MYFHLFNYYFKNENKYIFIFYGILFHYAMVKFCQKLSNLSDFERAKVMNFQYVKSCKGFEPPVILNSVVVFFFYILEFDARDKFLSVQRKYSFILHFSMSSVDSIKYSRNVLDNSRERIRRKGGGGSGSNKFTGGVDVLKSWFKITIELCQNCTFP